jgi:RimJ/RimL family protein N-acetyltransferase
MFTYENLSFRAPEERDLQMLYDMRYDESIVNNLFSVWPISMSNQKKWLENILNSSSKKILIITHKDYTNFIQPLGYARLTDIDSIHRKVEVGADIISGFRGQGLGQKTYLALLDFCTRQLNMRKIYLYVFENNETAIAVYKKVGFEVESILKEHIFRNGEYQNVLMMSYFNR